VGVKVPGRRELKGIWFILALSKSTSEKLGIKEDSRILLAPGAPDGYVGLP
jgi:hypothetical protein